MICAPLVHCCAISCRAEDQGETCCPNRVARLARLAGIKAQIGYKRRPGKYGGKPSIVVDNTLDRRFDVAVPNRAWVTDITYIKTYKGFLYLAVVIDLYSRRVIGPLSVNGINAKPTNNRSCIASFTYGCLAVQTCKRSPGAFGSRLTVHQSGMTIIPKAQQF